MTEIESHEVIVRILGSVPEWCKGEIVRCKDCKFFRASREHPLKKLCWKRTSWAYGSKIYYPEPDDFCSEGERR